MIRIYLSYTFVVLLHVLFLGCSGEDADMDASGVFESTEIVISSEVNGVIDSFPAEEGDRFNEGDLIAQIDVSDFKIQKEQLEASIGAITQKQNDPGPQILVLQQQQKSAEANLSVLQKQKEVLMIEDRRVKELFAAKAATEKQVDDIDGQLKILEEKLDVAKTQIDLIEAQIKAARQQISIQNRGITSEQRPLEKQKLLIENQLQKGKIQSRMNGTMLSKYAYEGEFVNIGKPLLRMADLNTMYLKAYIDGNQLSQVKIGQSVDVYIDEDEENYKTYEGIISWISDKAEFTPKSIQTKNERANLVYAIKIKVKNDGYIKIGMYGEVKWIKAENE